MDRWRVEARPTPERLDKLLAERYGVPRNQVQRWVVGGAVRVNDRPAKSSLALAGGEWVECEPLPRPRDDRVTPEEGSLVVLYEDADLVVVDKPAGLAVHPGAGRRTGTLSHRLLARYPEVAAIGGPGRPGIVHRLDIGTTGALVVARSERAYLALSRAFAARRVDKRYLAIVYGEPALAEGAVESPIGRHPRRRREMAVRPGGRPARTLWRVRAATAGLALLEIALATGRTHQIRVHLKALRHPLVGDATYGEARWKSWPRPAQSPLRDFSRPALHAWRIAFAHPGTAERVQFEAPVPEDLRRLWTTVTGVELAL
jgi:23S rRNA pseudouridine1911/1915/1917 synthase